MNHLALAARLAASRPAASSAIAGCVSIEAALVAGLAGSGWAPPPLQALWLLAMAAILAHVALVALRILGRSSEYAMLRAEGASAASILCLAGAEAGILAVPALLLAPGIAVLLRRFEQTVKAGQSFLHPDPARMAIGAMVVVVIATLAAILPAALRLRKPISASLGGE